MVGRSEEGSGKADRESGFTCAGWADKEKVRWLFMVLQVAGHDLLEGIDDVGLSDDGSEGGGTVFFDVAVHLRDDLLKDVEDVELKGCIDVGT